MWRGIAAAGVVVDADGTGDIAPGCLRLSKSGDGERQLPNTASWNAEAVGDGLEYSDRDERPTVGIDKVIEGLEEKSPSISSMGVLYERSSSSENGEDRKMLVMDGRVNDVWLSRATISTGGDIDSIRCEMDSGSVMALEELHS